MPSSPGLKPQATDEALPGLRTTLTRPSATLSLVQRESVRIRAAVARVRKRFEESRRACDRNPSLCARAGFETRS